MHIREERGGSRRLAVTCLATELMRGEVELHSRFTVLLGSVEEVCGRPGLVVEMDFHRREVEARAYGFDCSEEGVVVGKTRFGCADVRLGSLLWWWW